MNTIYWITILDNIREWGVALGIVSLLPLFYSIMLWCNDVDSDKLTAKKILNSEFEDENWQSGRDVIFYNIKSFPKKKHSNI